MADNGKYDGVLRFGAQIDENSLYNQVARVASRLPTLELKTKNFGALGSFSKDSNEFQRSLQASSARVLAFSATAGQLYAISRGFQEIVKSTVEVEKALADINVVLNLSSGELSKFSKQLFNAANLTGQGFKTASEAALEFSRQGLSTAETIKRTADALTLVRFSGLDAAKAVSTITATLNSFNDGVLDSTRLINKLISVDQAFAVSSRDIAEALERTGSTASDVGVDINSLIGLVTAAKQVTGRDGAVIGNALKTIFQRVQRPEVLSTLREFNVQIEDSAGVTLSADKILQNLAKSYQGASNQQKNFIVQLAAGVYQSNQFRAILNDLAKSNSIYASATNIASNASDEANERQKELNKTLSAQLQVLRNQITQASSVVGDLTIKPVIENITGFPDFLRRLTGSFGEESQNVGSSIGTGILKGLGSYLSGPGTFTALILAGKLFGSFAGFAARSFGNILETTTKEFGARQAIQGLLAQQPALMAQINRGALSQVEIQQAILNSLRAQSLEMARQGQIISAAKNLVGSGAVSIKGGGLALGKVPRFGKDLDYKVPNFAISDLSKDDYGSLVRSQAFRASKLSFGHLSSKKDIKSNLRNFIPNDLYDQNFYVAKDFLRNATDKDFEKLNRDVLRKIKEEQKLGISSIPNFANSISSAISREHAAGIPKSLIRVGQSPSLKSSINPAGLGVYNLRDEPQGLNQGIQRVLSQGKNPKLNGIPNFATPFDLRSERERNLISGDVKNLQDSLRSGSIGLKQALDNLKKLGDISGFSADKLKNLTSSLVGISRTIQKPSNPLNTALGAANQRYPSITALTVLSREDKEKIKKNIEDRIIGLNSSQKPSQPRSVFLDENLNKRRVFNLPNAGQVERQRNQQFLSSFLLNKDARALTTKPDLSSLQSIGLYSSVTRKESTEQLSARLASERLQKLESRAGIFTKDGRQAASDLKKADPDRFRGFQQSLQNKAFLASIVGPILGGIGQEAAGSETTGQRGRGQLAAGLGNAAGFAATGFVLGGPGGAVAGGVLGLALELPKVIKAFSDTLPDLQKKFEKLKDISQQTSSSFATFIDSSEKLQEANSGKISLTGRQVKELEEGQRGSLLGIGNLKDRNRVADLVKNNELTKAREEINIINQRNSQAEAAAGLLANTQSILPNILSESQIKNTAANKFRISGVGDFGARNLVTKEERDIFENGRIEFISKQVNDPTRKKQIDNLIGQREQAALGLINDKQRDEKGNPLSVFDVLSKDSSLSEQLTGAKSGEFGKTFLNIFTAIEGFDESAVIAIAESFTQLEKKLGPEFRKRIEATISPEGLKEATELRKIQGANAIKSSQALFELNKTLFESQKRFQELGTSIEISGIQKLGQLTTNLRKNEINQSSSNRIDLLSRNGDNLSNLFNFTETLSANRNQTTLQREQLSNKTGGNIFDVLDNLRNTGIQRIRAESVDEGGNKSLKDIKEDINKFNQTFNQSFQPFIDRLNNGEQVTSDFLRSLEDTTKSQLQNLDRNRVSSDKSQTESIKALNDFSQAIFKLSKDFKVAGEQITSDSKGAGEIALENFRNKQREIIESRRVRQDISGATSGIDLGVISRQAQLSRQQLGANPEQLIRLRQQSDLIGFGGDRLKQAIGDKLELGKLGLTPENLSGELQRLISEGQQTIGNLEKIVRLGGGEQAVKDLNIANDRTNALIDLQNEYNKEKAKLNALSKEEIENLKTQLAFSSDILNVQRRINEENSRKGDFKAVRENLGETFTKSLSFNSNDFYNELSKNTADFGEEFKQTFKDGFAEAATGAKSFEDALTNIGLSLGKNILTKASNLATDQLFGSLFGNQSNLTGGAGILSGLFSGKKYAKGGYVNQGSGTKDDVPALLSGGEFVVKKSSTQKLGKNFLNALNNGGLIRGYASGGLSTKQLSKLPPQKQQDIINAISAQSLDASFANEYFGEKSKSSPTKGSFNTSALLSDIALTDENNPQNKLKFDRERYFIDLKAYERQKRKALNQFNKAQTARRTSAYISAAINFAGSVAGGSGGGKPVTTSNPTTNVGRLGGFDFNGIQSYSANYVANGGLIKKYDRGGSVFGGDDIRDNIPAYLMGGEFVVNKNAVQKIGTSNLNHMNKTGRVPGFANGGYVGDSNSISYGTNNDIASKYFSELISISAQIRDNINNNNKTGSSGEINISNTITVNISDSGIKTNSSSQVNNKEDSNNKDKNNQDKQNQGKQLGQVVTQIVNATLVKESKNGGLLESVFKKK